MVVSVSAAITLEPIDQTIFNVGDPVTVEGTVAVDSDVRGDFLIQLVCGDTTTNLLRKLYSFDSETEWQFSESLFVFSDTSGECYFKAVVNDGNSELYAAQLTAIEVTNELNLDLTLDKNATLLGGMVEIAGTVSKASGELVTGSAVITLKESGSTFLSVSTPIENGDFSHSLGPLLTPGGTYDVEVIVRDSVGNSQQGSLSLSILSDITVEMSFSPSEVFPGETVNIDGVFSYGQEGLQGSASIALILDGEEIELGETNERFSYEWNVPSSMVPGLQSVLVTVEDSFGNTGEALQTITIKPSPSSLDHIVDSEVLPGNDIMLQSNVLDQSGNVLDRTVQMSVRNGVDILWESVGQSGESQAYHIEDFTPPQELVLWSSYQLTADEQSASGETELVKQSQFSIGELKEVESSIEGSELMVINVGNVRYAEELSFTLVGENEYDIFKFVDLMPGENVTFNIGLDVPEDDYSILLPFEAAAQEVSVVDSALKEELESGFVNVEERIGSLRSGMTILFVIILIFVSWWSFFHLYHVKKQGHVIHDLVKGKIEDVEKEVFHHKNVAHEHKKKAEKHKEDSKKHQKKAANLGEALQKETQEKKELKNLFETFVDAEVVKEVVNKQDLTHGEERDVTAMFADIRGFTKLTEKSDVWDIKEMLNASFEEMSQAVKVNKGIVNKFMGDSMFALFNAPNSVEDHTMAALRTALAMRGRLQKINKQLLRKGKSSVKMGIGVNTGKALIGNFGAIQRLEYTAIGDSVNVAARLESSAKGGQVLITEETYSKIKDKIHARYLGPYKVKNKARPLKVYDVIDLK
tara:strand:- start:2347 stop:4779 length:2433 start_codon:yes stop_codon:yes gene_type:complete